jgi:hypothetical protein
MKSILFIFIILTSCRSAEKLHDLSVKRGIVHEPITKVVTVTDTLKGKDGKDSIIYRDIACVCPEPIIQTRWRVRFDNRRFNDSLKHVRRTVSDSTDNAVDVFELKIEMLEESNKHIQKLLDKKRASEKDKIKFWKAVKPWHVLLFLILVMLIVFGFKKIR